MRGFVALDLRHRRHHLAIFFKKSVVPVGSHYLFFLFFLYNFALFYTLDRFCIKYTKELNCTITHCQELFSTSPPPTPATATPAMLPLATAVARVSGASTSVVPCPASAAPTPLLLGRVPPRGLRRRSCCRRTGHGHGHGQRRHRGGGGSSRGRSG